MSTILTDFLQVLGVPHTPDYTDSQFRSMPFQSLFGLTKVLERYGVPTDGLRIADKDEITALAPPFIADTPPGLVIVTSMADAKVTYMSQGDSETMSLPDFKQAWNGVVLLAFPTPQSIEPDYREHRAIELANASKRWILMVGAAALFVYLFVTNGIYRHVTTVALTLFNIVGLILTYMLVQKTLKIKSKAADRVCGVLEEGGCDSILELRASSFFGIFKWSEVGITYFSVSLLTLLIFPQYIGYLALCNACCLPFTLWSIWYQKWRAKVWCTLCVSVQATLWVLFICYLSGGWFRMSLPLSIDFFVLVVTYVTVLLGVNRVMSTLDTNKISYYDEPQNDSPTAA